MSALIRTARLAPVVLTILAVLALHAPGAAAAGPTLKTIAIDGDATDWSEVLQNPLQVTLDGDSSNFPCELSPDLDCPVQSTGRDLRRIAWTHDDANVFVFIQRQGSSNNGDVVWIYLDVTGGGDEPDALMGAGDHVLRIEHRGQTRRTSVSLHSYLPENADGDPMVDAEGRADGHRMPGGASDEASWSSVPAAGGMADGRGFEERVPWSALGVAPGTPVTFHVASSNVAEPSRLADQVDDNAGGPDGGHGSFGHADHSLGPDREATVPAGEVARHRVTLENRGSWAAAHEVSVAGTLGLATLVYHDADGDGAFDQVVAVDANGDGDFLDPSDILRRDLDGDGFPEVGPSDGMLEPGERTMLLVEVITRPGQDGLTDRTTISSWPASDQPADTRTLRSAELVTHVGRVSVAVTPSRRSVVPGESASYALRTCNVGAPDTFALRVEGVAGWNVELWSDEDRDGRADERLALDRRGNGSWDVVEGGDSDADGSPDTGPLPTGLCAAHVLLLHAPPSTSEGDSEQVSVSATGRDAGASDAASLSARVASRLEISPDHILDLGTGLAVTPGRTAWFPHVVRHAGAEIDTIDFAAIPPANDQGLFVRIWSDPDGDGRVADGRPVTTSDPIAANGGEWRFVAEVRVPDDAVPGTLSRTLVSGVSVADPSTSASVLDELEVSAIATYRDAALAIPAIAFAPCVAIHAEGTQLERSPSADPYDLAWFDGATSLARFHDAFAPDNLGRAVDQHDVAAGDASGDWSLELLEETLVAQRHALRVEGQGHVAALEEARATPYLRGGDLAIHTLLVSEASIVAWEGTVLEHVVLAPNGDEILRSGPRSSFGPREDGELTRSHGLPVVGPAETLADELTIPDVTYPEPGLHSIEATWRASCGSVLATARTTFEVLAGEDCGNGDDDDADGLIDCDDTDCDASPECAELDCSNSMDDDADGLIDCEDTDCLSAGGDCDGDGVSDPDDCAPDDGSLSAPPEPPRDLRVAKSAPGVAADAMLSWTAGGSGDTHGVIGGTLESLRERWGVSGSSCLASELAAPAVTDSRRPSELTTRGFYYLARSVNPCGISALGTDGGDIGRLVDPDPCAAP